MNGLERSEVPEWPLTFTHNRAAFFYFASHAESLSAFGGSLQNMRIFVTVTRNEAHIGAACEHQPCGIANAYSYV